MRSLHWLVVAVAALVATSAAVGAAPKKVTVIGEVQAVSPASIRVAGTFCVFAPTNSRMMMPAIIRDVAVGDSVQLTCARASGRLVVTRIVERPSGAVVARGAISATNSSITVNGVTCSYSVGGSPDPRIMAPTTIRGTGLLACLRANGQLVVTAAAELTPHAGRVVVLSGNVSSVSSGSITVSGVTCALPRGTKPLPEMPTMIKGVDVGDSVLLTCTALGSRLVATGVNGR